MKNCKKTITVAANCGIIALITFSASYNHADIVGSAHDFSPYGWSQNEICKPCHTPHNSNTDVGYLWNHEVTQAIYTLYDSPDLEIDPDQPGMYSRLCLSCHDGTVALDSFGGNAGSTMIEGTALIGTDLSNDHPVGLQWEHQDMHGQCRSCHFGGHHGGGIITSELPFYDGKIECMTCHSPHNDNNLPSMLRMTMDASQLCFYCHSK